MRALARKLGAYDYFTLAFGTMIGTGWLVLMDDWLGRGGPLGAMLAYLLGGLVLLPVGYVYGQWVQRVPDAAGEAAYTAQVFPRPVSYFTGWMMLLAYFIVCPWEAVAIGKIAAWVLPSLDSVELYRVAGQPVYLYRLLLGLALTLFLGTLNYRGIRLSANFQKTVTTLLLVLYVSLLAISLWRGSPGNFHPAFRAAPAASILLTLQIVPYFMTGFESVPKYAEEANPDFRSQSYMKAIALALAVGAIFYSFCIAAVSYVAPWQGLVGHRFATALAFESALRARWPVDLILIMATFGLFQCFNGNFAASTRLLFAFGRSGTIPPRFSRVHERFATPSVAVVAISIATLGGLLLGDALLVPVTEVGSLASATGWLMAALSFLLVEKRGAARFIAGVAVLVALCLVLMKLVPVLPGHFTSAEWIALALWLLIGAAFLRSPGQS